MSRSQSKSPRRIDAVEVTSDCLTGRAGLHLFARYLRGIELYPHLDRLFGSMRKHTKGHPIIDLFIQVFCFFFDGTSRHLTHFDSLAKDAGYAATIEFAPLEMVSSHSVKRFF